MADSDDDIETYQFNSTNLSEATFKKSTGETTIIFARDGREYDGVLSETEWRDLKSAPSAGRFFNLNLKNKFT